MLVKQPKPKRSHATFRRFAAIDFETANYSRDSACAVSCVVVESGKIIKKATSLLRPPSPDFVFTYIHGISWNDVAEQPTFREFWPTLKGLIEEVDFVAAHNASFDRGVLHACCERGDIPSPAVKYVCTMKLARDLWGLYPTKLPDVCRHFNIPLKHHDASSDALACAKIVLKAKKDGVPAKAFLCPL
ncbi:MAG: 3'-5' exonuclease [Elusimicrobia bacterium]|nr:3'-5' exonuclease [Elusimicrobiota bacterium]